MRDDLPPFRWTPPAQVILFPLTKRVGKIRHTANMLSRKHGEDANLYWKQIVAGLRRQLERLDVSKAEADDEIKAFFDAVQTELRRMAYECHGSPGGAA